MKRALLHLTALMLLSGCASIDKVFYHPDSKVYRTPEQDGLAYEGTRFHSADGTLLSGWFIPAKTPALETVIHFHGNAQNMTAHYTATPFPRPSLSLHGFRVFYLWTPVLPESLVEGQKKAANRLFLKNGFCPGRTALTGGGNRIEGDKKMAFTEGCRSQAVFIY